MAVADKWNGEKLYGVGEEVSHEGKTYVARIPVNNPLIIPHEGDTRFWAVKGAKEDKDEQQEVPVALSPDPRPEPVKAPK